MKIDIRCRAMKRTQFKDSVRNIRNHFISYFSVVTLSALAASSYLGFSCTADAIARSGSKYYNDAHYRDAEIASPLLITEEDLAAIRAVEGVKAADGVYQTSGRLVNGELYSDADIISLTEGINTPQVLEGRLPASANECVVETAFMKELSLKVGDTVSIQDANGEKPEYLRSGNYVITGRVSHPDHGCGKLSVPGDRNVIVLSEAFDAEKLENSYMKAVIDVEASSDGNRFDKTYLSSAEETVERLKALAPEREEKRFNEMRSRIQDEIDSGQEKLAAAEAELANTEKKLSDGREQAESTKLELDSLLEKLGADEEKLKASKKELDDTKTKLNGEKSTLDKSDASLKRTRQELATGYRQIELTKDDVRYEIYLAVLENIGEPVNGLDWRTGTYTVDPDNESASARNFAIVEDLTVSLDLSLRETAEEVVDEVYDEIGESELKRRLSDDDPLRRLSGSAAKEYITSRVIDDLYSVSNAYDSLASSASDWDKNHQTYLDDRKAHRSALDEYVKHTQEYSRAQETYRKASTELENGKTQYTEGIDGYTNTLTELEEGQKALEIKHREYEEEEAKLKMAQKTLSEQGKYSWTVLGAQSNASYTLINSNIESARKIGIVLSLVLIVLAALVIYTAVRRIVHKQRKLIGAAKAYGISNSNILGKYLIYGISGAILGTGLGAALAYYLVQEKAADIYGRLYVFDISERGFLPKAAAIAFAAGIIVSAAAVWAACSPHIRSSASTLLQDAPAERSRKREKKQKTSSVYRSLILRNMWTAGKRAAITVIGIAGCCTLLVSGLTIRSSVLKTLDNQYSKIELYDMSISFDTSKDGAEHKIQAILNDSGADWTEIQSRVVYFDNNGRVSNAQLICGDFSELNDFFRGTDIYTGKKVYDEGNGVWISNRAAETNDFSVGNEITLFDSSMNSFNSYVAGVYDLYIGREMLVTREGYKTIFGKESSNDTFLVRENKADVNTLLRRLRATEGVGSITMTEDMQTKYESCTSDADIIALIFASAAGITACFIMFSIMSVYVDSKKSELTAMRINGFGLHEVGSYILYEPVISTLLGMLIGLGTGSLLGYCMIRLMETDMLHLDRSIQFDAWKWTMLAALVFLAVICILTVRKARNFKLTDEA